ncbi:cysteine hydrolase family protein [Methylobacterium nodulans]|uniref:Isochorismatase hydrolase n=1 Tax=Methylobacterium nodulans (strain LMG 21967 / CNCM I-2342 / ORS 2060) TaxID=460265 RepID=B8IPV6_METNO|nr:cysteine hydrolase family protein [Methylobacterium nodulans]ACL56606.1 isochorismatase hydrolase [Methylobacterium nodulans ORS 2060]
MSEPRTAEPKTLLQLAGAPLTPARMAESVLVVIDAQAEYARGGGLPLDGFDAALARLRDLLAAVREAGAPVIHVAHRGRPGGLFDRNAPGGAILPEAAPAAGEPIVEKTLPNAFAGTDLAARLAALARPHLLLAGFMTHNCVSATARAGLDLGQRVTVAGDATATRALPDPMGGAPIAAAAIQRAALAGLADRSAVVAPTAAILRD